MKKTVRTAAVLLALLLTLTLASLCVSAAGAKVWDGSVATGFADASTGAEGDPIIITTGAELAYIAKQVDDGEEFEGVHFRLDNDIDLAGKPWFPIGTTSVLCFRGIFNGNGHTVSGLAFDNEMSSQTQNVGFFGFLQTGAEVINLKVSGEVSCQIKQYFGAVAGHTIGATVSNCSSDATLNISRCASSESTIYAGGIIGLCEKDSYADHCTFSGEINADGNAKSGHICAGGVLGRTSTAAVTYCLNTGKVTVNNANNGYAAGVLAAANSNMVSLENCASTGDLSAGDTNNTGRVGGIIAYASKEVTMTGCYSSGTLSGLTLTSGIITDSKTATTTVSNCITTADEICVCAADIVGTFTGNTAKAASVADKITELENAVKASAEKSIADAAAKEAAFVPAETTTEAPVVTDAPEVTTEAPSTDAPSTDAPATTTPASAGTDAPAEKNGGCGGMVSGAVVAVLLVSVLGGALISKK